MANHAKVGCISTLYPIGGGWVGKSPTGEVHRFRTLDDYKGYLKALGCPDVSVPFSKESTKREWTPPTGFLEFKPKNQAQQDIYSAMSPSWRGQDASYEAVDKGLFAEETSYFYKDANKFDTPANDYKPKDAAFPVWNPLG